MAIDFKMMDKKRLALIMVGIALALIAVVLTNNYIKESSVDMAKKIAGGMSSQETQQLLQRVQTLEQASQTLAANQNSLAQAQQQAAATAQQAVVQKPPAQPSLAIKTPMGKRAVTVMVDKLAAVGGLVSPGDYVDIIVHLNVPEEYKASKQADKISATLFQGVLVLAVGNNFQNGSGYEAQKDLTSIPITVALSPTEAGLMAFAQQNGTLQLVLRPPLDNQSFLLPVSNWSSLSEYVSSTQKLDLGISKQSSAAKQPSSSSDSKSPIEIFLGGQKTSK